MSNNNGDLEHKKALISLFEKISLVLVGVVASTGAWVFNKGGVAEPLQLAVGMVGLILFVAGFAVSMAILLYLINQLKGL